MTLLEVAIAAVIVTVILFVSNAAFVSSFAATNRAHDNRRVARLLDTVMEDVSAQPYSVLLSLNGNTILEGDTEGSSQYQVDLETFQADVDLIQVRAVAREIESGREVGRVVTLRSDR
ncbi:MAG: hypothetical protein R3F34_18605 [Planctomycetota bacterium]